MKSALLSHLVLTLAVLGCAAGASTAAPQAGPDPAHAAGGPKAAPPAKGAGENKGQEHKGRESRESERGPRDTAGKQGRRARIPTIVVTARRAPRRLFDLPRTVERFSADDFRLDRQVRTLPEALKEAAGISVQKTGPAQGSPKIRGQNGFRTLLLVDGIRINTSIWRSGNVEYWNTVDPLALESFEIVRGPSSVLYGSDGVFGTGQALSRGPGDPRDWSSRDVLHGRALVRYASAEEGFVERLESSGHLGRNFGFAVGLSAKTFGPLDAGQGLGRLPYTGYHETDGDVKLVLPLGESDRLTFAYQHAGQIGGPRTHSTVFAKSWRGTTVGKDFQRDIDQIRDLSYLRYEDPAADRSLTASYQLFQEREERIKSNSRRRIQGARVNQLALLGRQGFALFGGRLSVGFDAYHEEVDSSFREFNTDGSLRTVRPRGAVADEAYDQQFALYAYYERPLGEDFEVSGGLRWQYVELDADVVDIPGASGGPFPAVHKAWNAVVGEGSLVWKARPDLRIYGSAASSFRAPNLSDLTRFDVALSGDLEIPSTDVDPENFLSFELGMRYDDGKRRLAAAGWYTQARDLIQRKPTGNLVGGLVEVTKTNASDGYFTGFEAEGASVLDFAGFEWVEFYSRIDFVSALIDATDPADARRIRPKGLPPVKGQFGFKLRDPRGERWTAELFFPWAGGIDPSEYNAAERRNTQRIPPDGLPGYVLVGLRGTLRLNERLRAALSIENLTNRDYRIFDSGLNEPGLNVILSIAAEL